MNWFCRLGVMVLCTVSVLGCSIFRQYGDFANASQSFSEHMAIDAARQVSEFYPPARTRLKLQHSARDAFGTALTATLRGYGFAVEEMPLSSMHAGDHPLLTAGAETKTRTTDGTTTRAMAYVVDRLGDSQYLVSLHVGDESLARNYQVHVDRLVAVGHWVRKQ